jgi:hypothetical protein
VENPDQVELKKSQKRAQYPVKAHVLPLIYEGITTSDDLFDKCGHTNSNQFKGLLSKYSKNGMLTIDKTVSPWQHSLTIKGISHALDPDRGKKDGLAKKRAIFSGMEIVKTSKSVDQVPKHSNPIDAKIIEILDREGAITVPEMNDIATDCSIFNVRRHVLNFVRVGYAKIDLSTSPVMYYATPEGEEFIQKQQASTS